MNCVYFDNASTTRPHEAVVRRFVDECEKNFGNPSSLHRLGILSEKILTDCKKNILNFVNGTGADVCFTSGATESNNLAVLGYTKPFRGRRVISTKAEHPSVTACFKELAVRGFDVRYAVTDECGRVDAGALAALINEDTTLVSLSHVNSETGCVNDIDRLGEIIKKKNSRAVFHVDAAQSFGKLDIDMRKCSADLISLSAHKFHGIKGTGALIIKNGVAPQPLFTGGGQQKGLRPGTENTAGIAALDEALSLAKKMYASKDKINEINGFLRKSLIESGRAVINSPSENVSPYILNISFLGIMSETMLNALDDMGICVSAGSACSSKSRAGEVLLACKIPEERVKSAIRLSLSAFSDMDEAEFFIQAVNKTVPVLGRVKKKG